GIRRVDQNLQGQEYIASSLPRTGRNSEWNTADLDGREARIDAARPLEVESKHHGRVEIFSIRRSQRGQHVPFSRLERADIDYADCAASTPGNDYSRLAGRVDC